MDTSKVLSLLERLDDEIDDLEEAISPLVNAPLLESASKLPLLDKAKLYVLVTYAIESMLFSYVRLHGAKAREHPVFTELTRVKQYFQKLKVAENPIEGAGKRQNPSLDKDAAQRIIRAGLSGNDKYDLERAEQQAKERARAHIKFMALSEKVKQDEASKRQTAEEGVVEGPGSSDSESEADAEVAEEEQHKKKKRKTAGSQNKLDISEQKSAVSSSSEKSQRKKEKREKKAKKEKKEKKKKSKSGDKE